MLAAWKSLFVDTLRKLSRKENLYKGQKFLVRPSELPRKKPRSHYLRIESWRKSSRNYGVKREHLREKPEKLG